MIRDRAVKASKNNIFCKINYSLLPLGFLLRRLLRRLLRGLLQGLPNRLCVLELLNEQGQNLGVVLGEDLHHLGWLFLLGLALGWSLRYLFFLLARFPSLSGLLLGRKDFGLGRHRFRFSGTLLLALLSNLLLSLPLAGLDGDRFFCHFFLSLDNHL